MAASGTSGALGANAIFAKARESRHALGHDLDRRGYQTAAAVNGKSAVQALLRQPADIAPLDISIPGLSGADALPTLRGLAPHATVIMVTANLDVEIARRTLAHGAFDYLLKPVDFTHLAQSIEMAAMVNALDADIGGSSSPSEAPKGS